ncbi:hypothetical protein [Nocardia asiatica]|uniref:hypothetical protein n=1 Tax=Nocardia asiatica TaxID=209252 RepID=UPI0002F40E9B|nr:hypothetical protein [Nocardia asiatica]
MILTPLRNAIDGDPVTATDPTDPLEWVACARGRGNHSAEAVDDAVFDDPFTGRARLERLREHLGEHLGENLTGPVEFFLGELRRTTTPAPGDGQPRWYVVVGPHRTDDGTTTTQPAGSTSHTLATPTLLRTMLEEAHADLTEITTSTLRTPPQSLWVGEIRPAVLA